MDEIKSVIESLAEKEWYTGQIEHIEEVPRQVPEYEEVEVLPSIQEYLDEKDIQLYTHQAKTIQMVRNDQDVIITTPTASGKTLAFNIPILEDLIKDPEARALYIYPMKALSNDQFHTLEEMDEQIHVDVNPGVYDGDTPRSQRPRIRKESRIILTNPYGLHYYLPWHEKWRTFYENLEYVVMDEVHHYRGIFGSNVAMLVRRLLRVCEHYHTDPQFILSSATIANPREFSQKLIKRECNVVSEDGSAAGKKYFVFWNPVKHAGSSTHTETSRLLAHMVNNGLQTLCFTISRRMTELIARWSRERTSRIITAYRAGYLPEERRKIEKGLQTGRIDGVASTNALELGVDIGGLDVTLISGYPGTVISTWQQAGRAGRGEKTSAAFLIAFENPLDQYFMHHPSRFFGKSHEHAIIDVDNPNIAMGHLMCAASEVPIKENDPLYEAYTEEIESLEAKGLVHKTPVGYVYSDTKRPAEIVKLNNISEDVIKVVDMRENVLETMENSQAYREAHDGAVLLHQGETYLVKNLDLDAQTASVTKKEVDYHTEAMSQTDLTVQETFKEMTQAGLNVCYGKVTVSEYYLRYTMKKFDRVLGRQSLDLPPITFETESTWIQLPSSLIDKVQADGLSVEGGLHALEHAMITMVPFHAMCDRWDIGGVSTPFHSDIDAPGIFIYDAYEGGIGITEKCFRLIKDLLETTYELIKDCECENGCPSCIYSPKCGNNNEPLDKQAAITILAHLVKKTHRKEI